MERASRPPRTCRHRQPRRQQARTRCSSRPATGGSDWFSTWENNLLYAQLATKKAYAANFYDVKTGSNGVSAPRRGTTARASEVRADAMVSKLPSLST